MTIVVCVLKSAIVLQKYDTRSGQMAGAAVTLRGTEELDALSRGLEMIMTD
jgi:hypothetical protein